MLFTLIIIIGRVKIFKSINRGSAVELENACNNNFV